MTVAEMILRIRSVFNETGATSGFLSDDNNIKKYIDTAQNTIIDRLINLQKSMRQIKPFFEYESLKILIVLKSFDLATGVTTYSLAAIPVTNYKDVYDLQADLTDSGTKYGATYKGIAEMKWKENNEYARANYKFPYYAIDASTEIIINPAPTADVTDGADFRYYRIPTAVSGSTQITLGTETHEAIMHLALSYAYDQDKEQGLSMKYLKLFEQNLAMLL